MEKVFDIRTYLNDKRTYVSLKGHKIDFSFRPTALDELFAEYTKRELKVLEYSIEYSEIYNNYKKNTKDNNEADTKDLTDKAETLRGYTNETRDLGISIIMLAAKANGNDEITTDWIDNELDPREFGFILRFIMGVEDQLESKKK